jgi:plasmid maintenance system killer protein
MDFRGPTDNDCYRVCFFWERGDARRVEIADYH